MSRTAEQRVASSRRARALRAEGKPIWSRTIPVRALISERRGATNADVASVAVAIAALMRSSLPPRFFDVTNDDYDFDFVDAIEDLEEYSETRLDALAAEGENVPEMFNGSMNVIYDWADRTRVWLGA